MDRAFPLSDIVGRPGHFSELAVLSEENSNSIRGLHLPASFLLETLIRRPTFRRRSSVPYFGVRQWRRPIERFQMHAFDTLRADPPAYFVQAVCRDIMEALHPILGAGGGFRYVVPLPGSRPGQRPALAMRLATNLASGLGMSAISAISVESVSWASPASDDTTCPAMRLAHTIDAPAIVIEEVTDSGSRLEEAVLLLRPKAGAVMAISWIVGKPEPDIRQRQTKRGAAPSAASSIALQRRPL